MDSRYDGGTQSWAENLDVLFTFRGIPCLYYGSELEFQKGVPMDVGPNAPLSTTGRAYFGDYLEGDVTATDFGTYSNASGAVASTLEAPLAVSYSAAQQNQKSSSCTSEGSVYKKQDLC